MQNRIFLGTKLPVIGLSETAYNTPSNSTTFLQIPDFTVGAIWIGSTVGPKNSWWFNDRSRWLTITDLEMIPNGNTTSSTAIPGEKWVARRWISTIEGRIMLAGEVFKKDATCGDGATAHIFVNDIEQWSQFIAANDAIGIKYNLVFAVNIGCL